MKKRDIAVILVVLVVALVGIFFINLNKAGESDTILKVTSKGKIAKEMPLTLETNETFNIETDLGLNKVKVENGVVSIYEADCPDQICVDTVPIDEVGELIVCLPNQVIVEIIKNN